MIPAIKKQDLFLAIQPKNEIQTLMLNSASKGAIKDSDRRETMELLKIALDGIRRDIGIRTELEDMDKARLIDITLKYYSSLSVSEIKLAFEFLSVGELDKYLPKDKDGNPDKNHYHFFSVEYYTKIIRAYIRKKDSIRSTIPRKAIPSRDIEAEKKYYKSLFNSMVREYYVKYVETGMVEVAFPFVILQEMRTVGLFDGEVLISDEEKLKYTMQCIATIFSSADKRRYTEELKNGTTPKDIENRLILEKENDLILEIFRKIKESNQPIENYFPQ